MTFNDVVDAIPIRLPQRLLEDPPPNIQPRLLLACQIFALWLIGHLGCGRIERSLKHQSSFRLVELMSIHFHLQVVLDQKLLFFKAVIEFGNVLVNEHFEAPGSLIDQLFAFGIQNFEEVLL